MNSPINYISSGSGEAFVFLHGLGADINQVLGIFDDFQGVKLISSEARGHGKSLFDPENLPSFDRYADDVIKVLDKEGIHSAIFGGISMGSGISINIALRYPARVKGLVLVRPAWLDKASPANLDILLDIAKALNQPQGKEEFEQSKAFVEIQAMLPSAAKSIMGQFNRDQGAYTSQVLTSMVQDFPFPNLNDLQKISVPTLLIGNEDDPLHPWKMAEIIQQYIPNSQLTKVVSRYVDGDQHKKALRTLISDFISTLN